jgi:RNA polymerase sigma-70 factor (ECF subfamily)
MTNESSDAQLISSILLFDDHRAFKMLSERYRPKIKALFLKLTTGDTELSNDLMQETYLTMYRRLATFNGKSAFGTWLYQVAYREFLQMHRARKPHYTDIHADHVTEQYRIQKPDAVAQKMDINMAMNYLREEERMAIYLSYAEGYHHEEIAEIMQVPLGTVKSYILRGRNKLRELLS